MMQEGFLEHLENMILMNAEHIGSSYDFSNCCI